jgi:hypothetical protein
LEEKADHACPKKVPPVLEVVVGIESVEEDREVPDAPAHEQPN